MKRLAFALAIICFLGCRDNASHAQWSTPQFICDGLTASAFTRDKDSATYLLVTEGEPIPRTLSLKRVVNGQAVFSQILATDASFIRAAQAVADYDGVSHAVWQDSLNLMYSSDSNGRWATPTVIFAGLELQSIHSRLIVGRDNSLHLLVGSASAARATFTHFVKKREGWTQKPLQFVRQGRATHFQLNRNLSGELFLIFGAFEAVTPQNPLGSTYKLWLSRSLDDGDTWSEPSELVGFDNPRPYYPDILSDHLGSLYAYWSTDLDGDPLSTEGGAYAISQDSGRSWSMATHFHIQDGAGFIIQKAGLIDDTNRLHLLFIRASGLVANPPTQLFYVTAASAFSSPTVTQLFVSNRSRSASILRNAFGQIMLIWYDELFGRKGIFCSQLNRQISSAYELGRSKPHKFELSQNYPNPFNPSTTIRYALPVASSVSLKIYDVLGREVATLVNQRQAAGEHHVRFNASGLTSGVYFYRLQAGGYAQTKKMMLAK